MLGAASEARSAVYEGIVRTGMRYHPDRSPRPVAGEFAAEFSTDSPPDRQRSNGSLGKTAASGATPFVCPLEDEVAGPQYPDFHDDL